MNPWLIFRKPYRSKKDLRLIRFFIKRFGYRPKNILFFKIALTHKSISNTSKKLISNERLEFLGDTIIDAVIADHLFHKFPDKDEGHLTKLKSKIVSRKSLSNIAKAIQLEDFLIYLKGKDVNVSTLVGNAFEAIIGAIYLDGGYEAAKKTLIHKILRIYVDLPTLLKNDIDFKSKLYIWCQKNKLNLEFKLVRENHEDEAWRYEVEAFVNHKLFGKGRGASKKKAEQAAAKETIDLIGTV